MLAKKKVEHVGKAQLKITAIVLYYTIAGVIGLVSYTYFEANNSYQQSLAEYILCESAGVSAGCVSQTVTTIIGGLSAAIIIVLSLLPIIAVLFNFDLNAFKKKRTLN